MKAPFRKLLILSATVVLASCGGGTSSALTSSSGDASPAASDSSSAPAASSDSSATPVSDVYNIYKAATDLANALNKEGLTVKASDLLDALAKTGEDFEVEAGSSKKLSEAAGADLLYFALKDNFPARIGARSFQGYYFNPADVSLRSLKDTSANSITAKALEFLSNTGIFTVPATTSLSGGKALAEKNFKKYLDRIHAYCGNSLVDDFFTTVNHDYLYDDNPYEDRPNDGRATWEEEYDEENLVNTYDSRLIPEEDIVSWSLSLGANDASINAFIETYCDFDARATGKAAGVVEAINKYLAATTAEEFIEVCREMALQTGYCILWDDASTTKYSLGDMRLLTLSCYSYSSTSSEATSGRTTSINRFKPIFQDVLGNSDDAATKLATDYSDYKIEHAKHREKDTNSDKALLLTSDPKQVEDKPNLYMCPTFSTGETLDEFFVSLGYKTECVLYQSSADIFSVVDLINDNTLDLIKGMAVWQMLQHYTICLPDTEAVNGWAFKPGYGINRETLWDNLSAFYSYGMPYLNRSVSNAWVNNPEFLADHRAVVSVVDDVKNAMLNRINAADWLSKDAKDKAKLKIDNLSYSVGGKLSNGNTLSFETPTYTKESLYKNIGAHEKIELETNATIAGASGEMGFEQYVGSMNPLEANAFYAPSYNGINITLGFMACYDDAFEMTRQELLENYGWVVAHEISHGFDSSGIYFDEKGEKHAEGWFLEADQVAYSARCKGVSDYYNGYEVMPNKATEGATVLTEAIADINGLHLCMEVAKDIDDFDYQSFFIANAEHFASYASAYTYSSALASDEHPFGRARINLAVMAVDEFHTAFGTKEGDNMYVAPADRIAIW